MARRHGQLQQQHVSAAQAPPRSLAVTRALAEKWLAYFRSALDIAVTDVDARRVIYEKVEVLGFALINEGELHTALRARSHGTCLRYKPAVESIDLARRGKATALHELLAGAHHVLASIPTKLLHLAVLAGCMPVVGLLLDAGFESWRQYSRAPELALTDRETGFSFRALEIKVARTIARTSWRA